MGWHRVDLERLAKVLALASSNRDGEALNALRKAEKMLTNVGLGLTDLADSIKRLSWDDAPAKPTAKSTAQPRPEARPPRPEIELLMTRLTSLHDQLNEAARVAAVSAVEAERWREIAWDAARHICALEAELTRVRGPAAAARPSTQREREPLRPDGLRN